MVVITGQVPRAAIGTDAFQETDIFGITLPIVKHSWVVRDPRDIARIVAEAFLIASTGRPGPVLIDVPKDVGVEEFDYTPVEPVHGRPCGLPAANRSPGQRCGSGPGAHSPGPAPLALRGRWRHQQRRPCRGA